MNENRQAILQLATAYWISRCVYCAAKFRWADHVHSGKHRVDEIGKAAGTVPELTHRMLRALASIGVFEETAPGRFEMTPTAQFLRSDHPQGVRDFAEMVGSDLFQAWVHLDAILTGDVPAIFKMFGEDYFHEIGRHPDKVRLFDRAMQQIHGAETPFVLEHHDFSAYRTFMDVGGGNGGNLYGFLERYPAAKGVLFDLPQVIEGARRTLPKDDVTARIAFEPGDFFVGVSGAADCILMRRVIHDWDDTRGAMILRHVRKALAPQGRIWLIEKVIGTGNDPTFEKLLDINMMVIGGQERTADEYRRLAAAADMRVVEIRTFSGPVDLIGIEP